jgi:hypothetical protein
LAHLTLQLGDAQTMAHAGLTSAATFKRAIDSIVAHPQIDTVYTRRQYTLVRRDTLQVVDSMYLHDAMMGMTTLAAERDTAIADRDDARADVLTLHTAIRALDSAATAHAAADSARFTHINITLDSAQQTTHHALALVRPRWYRRWGAAVVRGAKVAGVVAIAYTLGRVT